MGAEQAISGQIEATAISGQVDANEIEGHSLQSTSSRDRTTIIYLNHCDYTLLGCGGAVANKTCASVFVIREIISEFATRWLQSEEIEV